EKVRSLRTFLRTMRGFNSSGMITGIASNSDETSCGSPPLQPTPTEGRQDGSPATISLICKLTGWGLRGVCTFVRTCGSGRDPLASLFPRWTAAMKLNSGTPFDLNRGLLLHRLSL